MNRFKEYFSQEINLLGYSMSRFNWHGIFIFSFIVTTTVYFLIQKIVSVFNLDTTNIISIGANSIFAITISFVLLKIFTKNKLNGFILTTLLLNIIIFTMQEYYLNKDFFPPFTERTILIIWISLSFLLISIFYQRISKWILLFILPILVFGFIISFCFFFILSPFLSFTWKALLPFTPLINSIGFLIMSYRCFSELRENKYYIQYTFSKYLTYGMLFFMAIYSIWFQAEWSKGQFIIRNHFLENRLIYSKRSLIDDDLPAWASLGMKLPVNHVSELYLQPAKSTSQSNLLFFNPDKILDPLAFLVSKISNKVEFSRDDREHLLKLLFGYNDISLRKRWNGNSLHTTDLHSYIKIYPESKVAYTETKFSLKNPSTLEGKEAIYNIKIPEGSVSNKFTVWIKDKEKTATLSLRSTINSEKKTSNENSNSHCLIWKEDNLLRIKVFVEKGSYRTFKIGYSSPLNVVKNKLEYKGFNLEGPEPYGSSQKINIDLITEKSLNLFGDKFLFEKNTKKPFNKAKSNWFTYGKYKENWNIYIDGTYNAPEAKDFLDQKIKVSNLQLNEFDFKPKNIYLLINASLSKTKWKAIYLNLLDLNIDSQIILVTNEWFHSKNKDENLDFIESQSLPKFNLFPFYKIANDTDILIITNKEENSIPFNELQETSFFDKNLEFFSKNKKKIYVHSLNNELSTYFQSLKEFELIQFIPFSLSQISEKLILGKIKIPIQIENKYSFANSEITVELSKNSNLGSINENDDLARLILFRKTLRMVGKNFKAINQKSTELEVLNIAKNGTLVTPFTGLIISD